MKITYAINHVSWYVYIIVYINTDRIKEVTLYIAVQFFAVAPDFKTLNVIVDGFNFSPLDYAVLNA